MQVFGCPTENFTLEELATLSDFIASGGSLLVLLSEGGEKAAGTNINLLIQDYGISINSDSVIQTVNNKYLHPKEV